MATFKILIREKNNQKTQQGTYNVKIRVYHKGDGRDISTDIYITPDQLENGNIINHGSASIYNIRLRTLLNLYEGKKDALGARIQNMDCKALVNHLKGVDQYGRDPDFYFMAKKVIQSLESSGQISYANSMQQTVNRLKAFSGPVLLYAEITPEYLERFERSDQLKNLAVNSRGLHLRNIRAIYNKGIDAEKVDPVIPYPFRRFKIKQAKSRDKDMDIEDLRTLRTGELKLKSHKRSRDLFMLSFYLCGLNFKDMLHSRKTDVRKGRLIIDRAKTDQPLSIKITPQAQEIIDRYPGKKYLLSILEEKLKTASPSRRTIIYKDVTDQTNQKLKKIAELLEIPYKLSTYYARHTWSSIAFNECGASEEIIGLALGHASTRSVTAGYIKKKYDQVDKVNEEVIAALV